VVVVDFLLMEVEVEVVDFLLAGAAGFLYRE
jgi:hypothetical protein